MGHGYKAREAGFKSFQPQKGAKYTKETRISFDRQRRKDSKNCKNCKSFSHEKAQNTQNKPKMNRLTAQNVKNCNKKNVCTKNVKKKVSAKTPDPAVGFVS
jgi:nitrate/TMAO reductase-like tetraheme cytochrome c subunit